MTVVGVVPVAHVVGLLEVWLDVTFAVGDWVGLWQPPLRDVTVIVLVVRLVVM